MCCYSAFVGVLAAIDVKSNRSILTVNVDKTETVQNFLRISCRHQRRLFAQNIQYETATKLESLLDPRGSGMMPPNLSSASSCYRELRPPDAKVDRFMPLPRGLCHLTSQVALL